ncbi:TPA: hypothetical protein P3M07_000555 [Klebsiella pneumoniae]|nr:hypothetical protein [Klebsiella pneumoniae]
MVECDCGKIYPSSELSGGEPMGESGDYSDCYCPHCGEGEEHFAECADPETAWKAQQDKIDALVEALEKAQHTITEMDNRIRQQNRNVCELFDDGKALREQIAELESRIVTVKLPDLRQIVSGDRYVWSDGVYNYSQDVKAALTAAGIKVEAE